MVVRRDREFQFVAAARGAESVGQGEQPLDLAAALGPCAAQTRLAAVSAGLDEARHPVRTQQRQQRVDDIAAAVQLDQQVEGPRLHAFEEARPRCQIGDRLRQARVTGKGFEMVDAGPALGECCRPGQTDQGDLGARKRVPQRAQRPGSRTGGRRA
jgi:hypothetical protein